jgi:hypothetical protein
MLTWLLWSLITSLIIIGVDRLEGRELHQWYSRQWWGLLFLSFFFPIYYIGIIPLGVSKISFKPLCKLLTQPIKVGRTK